MKRRNFLALGAMAAACGRRPLFAAANNIQLPSADTVHVGGSKRIQIAGGHWVWTKKVGSGDIKVLLLHGGPGADHRYFDGFEDFLPLNGIEFYYYDQLDSTGRRAQEGFIFLNALPSFTHPSAISAALLGYFRSSRMP